MGPGDEEEEDWDEGDVVEEDDSSLGELWPECLELECDPASFRLKVLLSLTRR